MKLDFEDHIDRLAKDTLGEDDYWRLLSVLDGVANGLCCGVEMYYSTLPKILAKHGVVPSTKYEDMYGFPSENGSQAATPAQRQDIEDALKRAGF